MGLPHQLLEFIFRDAFAVFLKLLFRRFAQAFPLQMRLIDAFDFVEFVASDGGRRWTTVRLTYEVRISEMRKSTGLTKKEGKIKKFEPKCTIAASLVI